MALRGLPQSTNLQSNLLDRFKGIVDVATSKKDPRFKVLSAEESHTNALNPFRAVGALALGLIAVGVYVYRPAYQKASLVLGAASIVLGLLSRVKVETSKFKKQCQDIQDLYKGIALELRTALEVSSDVICAKINQSDYADLKDADGATTDLLLKSIKSQNDSYQFTDDDKPWMAARLLLEPTAEKISDLPMQEIAKDADLPLLFREKFAEVYTASQCLVKGYSRVDGNDDRAYVHNQLVRKDGKTKVVSTPWPIKA